MVYTQSVDGVGWCSQSDPDKNGQVRDSSVLPMANLIRDGKVFQIPSMMQTGKNVGMQIMDDSLLALVQEGKVRATEAALYAANQNRFKPLVDKEKQKQAT